MPKFFIQKEQVFDDHILITGSDVPHITRVLRMGPGDILTVCDGFGNDYTVKITATEKQQITAEILEKSWCDAEPATKVTLFQALPKQGKMEYIIQKNTELGVSKIVPVYTSRCIAKPSDKQQRWQKIALEAAKQCGRGIVPEVTETIGFDQAVTQISAFPHRMMLYECEQQQRLRELLQQPISEIAVFIGPEGGFALDEVEKVKQLQIPTVTLGRRILRTETAGAAVLPIILYEQKDI